MMMQLAVFCPRCGRQTRSVVDDDCPPSFVKCMCGERISLTVEEEELSYDFVDASGEGLESLDYGAGQRAVRL